MKFEEFYTTYYTRFIKYASYYVNNKETAEDIVQDVLSYYWENQDTLSKDTNVIAYIMLTVKNRCLNYLKHLAVEMEYNKNCTTMYEWEVISRIQTLEDENYALIFSKDIQKIMDKALKKLPDQTREIFILNRWENKSRKEIAFMLGVSQQKIDYHINKAISYLAEELKDYLPLTVLSLLLQSYFR